MDDTEILLVGWIVGLENSNAFPVEILRSKTVGQLKKAIKQEKKNALNHIDADELEIWKLKNPLSVGEIVQTLGTIGARDIPNADKLDPVEELSSYFPKDPVRKKVHLVVQLPYTAQTNEDEGPPPKRLKLGGDRSQEGRLAKLADFHRRYWGKPLDPAFTTLPAALDDLELDDEDDPSGGVLPGDPFLDGIDGRYLVRAEYIRAFDKVKALYDTSRSSHLAVITGQPGIGKTRWIDYALRRCLGEKQPVIYYLEKQTFLLSDTMKTVEIEFSYLQYPEYTWCFVDSTSADMLPQHVYNPLSEVFPIYVTSPKERRWVKLEQLRTPKLIIMNPWTRAELEKASVLYPDRSSEDISERFENAGPTARYCLAYTPHQIAELYAQRETLIQLDSIESMSAALLGDVNLRINDMSHRICVVRRLDSAPTPIPDSDAYNVEPITPFIRKRLLSQLHQFELADRIAMLNRFSRIPGNGGSKGVLFESVCQHRFAQGFSIVAVPMFRTNDPRSRWHAAFGDFSSTPKLHQAREELSPPVPISLSIEPARLDVYNSGPLAVRENIYYVPLSENEVAIDSFIVHAGQLYLFQFASGSKHAVKSGLLTTFARFSGLPAPGNHHFIFVVPKKLARFHCPHSHDGFLHDHVPYVAQVSLG